MHSDGQVYKPYLSERGGPDRYDYVHRQWSGKSAKWKPGGIGNALNQLSQGRGLGECRTPDPDRSRGLPSGKSAASRSQAHRQQRLVEWVAVLGAVADSQAMVRSEAGALCGTPCCHGFPCRRDAPKSHQMKAEGTDAVLTRSHALPVLEHPAEEVTRGGEGIVADIDHADIRRLVSAFHLPVVVASRQLQLRAPGDLACRLGLGLCRRRKVSLKRAGKR